MRTCSLVAAAAASASLWLLFFFVFATQVDAQRGPLNEFIRNYDHVVYDKRALSKRVARVQRSADASPYVYLNFRSFDK